MAPVGTDGRVEGGGVVAESLSRRVALPAVAPEELSHP